MNATSSPLLRIFLAAGSLLAASLPAVLSGAPTVLSLNNPGAIDGQNSWIYTPGTGTRASEVRGEPGGLFRIAEDGGILAASPRHFHTRAGLDGNPRMNNFAARPVTLTGTTYVRFLLNLEPRTPATFGTEPYEFFFGFGDNPVGTGFPQPFAALRVPVTGGEAGMEAVAPNPEAEGIIGQFFPDARVALNQTMFVVARFNVDEEGLLSGIDLWLNPESADGDSPDYSTVFEGPGPRVIGEPVEGVVGNASFRFRSQNGPARLDNLALGTSWADVVPAAYTGPFPRPPVVLAAPNDVVGMLGEEWTARAVLVEDAAGAAAVSVGTRETVSIFLVDSPAQITGYQWMFNTGTAIPAVAGGNLATMPFILHTSIQVGPPVRLPFGGVNSLAARVLLAAGGNLQTENARLAETPSTEIITQPVGRTVLDGDRVTLSVEVDSPFGFTLQWFRLEGDVEVEIEGADEAFLTFDPARIADSGEYFVRVTDETGGIFDSEPATLIVEALSTPEDARVVRLFPSPTLGDVIEFDGIEDDQLGPELSPHPLNTEPPTIASIPRGLFNARIAAAYNDGRGGVFGFDLDTAELVSGIPAPTAPGEPFLPFDFPVLRDGNTPVRDEDGNLLFNTEAEPVAGLGYIGEFLLRINEDRDIRVVPNVRNSGGFADGYAGRESGAPNYIHATGLLPHPNGFLVTDPFPLARINPHVPSGTNQITSSPPYMLGASSFLELTFDPEDLITLTGFVFINRNYFQSHRATKDFANKPNIRATATFTNGESRVDLRSTGFTFQGDDGPGLGQNTFFGFESPEEGYYLERIEVWALGNNFRLLFDIDDLAIAVEGVEGALPPVIATEPANKLVYPGDNVVFTVEVDTNVTEGDVDFQWFFGETELVGEVGNTLSLTNVSEADAGVYWVRLSNEVGETESRRASLTLRELPTFEPATLSVNSAGGQANVDVNVPAGIAWSLQPVSSWISVIDGGLGVGTDRITLSFSANNNVNERTGVLNLLIVVAGEPTPLASLEVVQAGAPPFFDIFETDFSVSASGGEAVIEILFATPGAPWSFDPGVDWIEVPGGLSGVASGDFDFIQLNVAPNPTGDGRSVEFKLVGTGFTISIQQDGASLFLDNHGEVLSVPASGGDLSLAINADAGASWSLALGAPWINSPGGLTGTGSAAVNLSIAQNANANSRMATVELVGTGSFVTVEQDGAPIEFNVTEDSLLAEAAGGTLFLQFVGTPGASWSFAVDADWVTVAPEDASGLATGEITEVALTIAPNPSFDDRSTTFDFEGTNITVNQGGVPIEFDLEADFFPVSALGGSIQLRFTGTQGAPWSFAPDVDWVTVANGETSGEATGDEQTVTLLIDPNLSFVERTTSFALVGSGFIITIEQAGAPVFFADHGENVDVPASGGSITLEIMAIEGALWRVSVDGDWITIPEESLEGEGPWTLSLEIAPNPSFDARTASVELEETGFFVTLVQEGANVFFASHGEELSLGADGGEVTLEISAIEEAAWSLNLGENWISSPGGLTGEGPSSVTILVQENTNANPRSAIVELEETGFFVTLRQEGAPIVFDFVETTFLVDHEGEEVEILFTGTEGAEWSFQPGKDWISPTAGSGVASGEMESVKIQVSPNVSALRRTAEFEFEHEGAGIAISIEQAGAPVNFEIVEHSFTLPAGGGDITLRFTGTPDAPWSLAPEEEWVIIAEDDRSGVATGEPVEVTVSVGPNLSFDGRSSVFGLEGSGIDITINQEGSELFLNDSGQTIDVEASGGTVTLGITATEGITWSLELNQMGAWISPHNGLSGEGSGEATLAIAPNLSANPRVAIVALVETGFFVRIRQAGALPVFEIEQRDISVGVLGGLIEIAFTGTLDAPWSLSLSDDWVVIDEADMSGVATGERTVLSLSIDPNLSFHSRMASIDLQGESISVEQDGAPVFLPDHAQEFIVPAIGDEVLVDIMALEGSPWSLAVDADWVLAEEEDLFGEGSAKVALMIEPNLSFDDRSTVIELEETGFFITIRQDGAPVFLNDHGQPFDDLPASGGQIVVQVSASDGESWSLLFPDGVDWITSENDLSGVGTGEVMEVTLDIDGNRSVISRSADIELDGTGFFISFLQEGAAPVFTFADESLSIGASGGDLSVRFSGTQDAEWSLVANQAWAIVGTSEGTATGDLQSVEIAVEANLSALNRSVTLELEGTDASITIEQAGAALVFSFLDESLSIGASGGSLPVRFTGTPDASWVLTLSEDWLALPEEDVGQVSTTDELGEVLLTVNPNLRATLRTAIVAVEGTEAFIIVTQDAAPIEFSIEESAFSLTSEGGRVDLRITGTPGAPWSFDPGVNWILAPDGMSGEASGEDEMIRLVVAPNLSFQERMVEFELVGTGFSITVTQAAAVADDLFPGATEFGPDGAFLLQGTWFVNGVLYTEVPGREGSFIYSPVHGWLGLFALDGGVWLYDFELSLWYFTNDEIYPWFFAGSDIGWMYYSRSTVSPNRVFWVASLDDWEEESMLSPPAP